jgi:hypothetical protein
MKPLIHSIQAATIAVIVSFGAVASSDAGVAVTWSGGNGTPLSVTFSSPVQFVITGDTYSYPTEFVMDGVGDLTNSTPTTVHGLTCSINGGPNINITRSRSGWVTMDVTANDYYFYGTEAPVLGDTVVLNPGTLTWSSNYTGAPPVNGSVNMFIADYFGRNVTVAGGTAVPELSSMLLGGCGLLSLLRRRR